MKYKNEPNHYTEKQVHKVLKKMLKVDIFISLAPPYSIAQNEDIIHQGFKAFDAYIERCQPKYWLHGHLDKKQENMINNTKVYSIVYKQPLYLDF